jgi:hypothetical protein
MLDYETRLTHAKASYNAGLYRVKNSPPPAAQKFPIGARVKIDDVLCSWMSHFKSGANATVMYTYAHAYGGTDVESYRLDIDDYGSSAWYYEDQLTLIDESDGEKDA